MMRQKLTLVENGSPSFSLRRMNGFSPVRITWLGSAAIVFSSRSAAGCLDDDRLCRSPARGGDRRGRAGGPPVFGDEAGEQVDDPRLAALAGVLLQLVDRPRQHRVIGGARRRQPDRR